VNKREFITLLGGAAAGGSVALCGAINVNWLTHARGWRGIL
jgi:hypothetical protein